MTIAFTRATKAQLKARFAIDGPTGAGKTWTSLEVAAGLVNLGDRVVLIDTERGSGALYSDEFDYDYFRFEPPFDPARLVEVLRATEAKGYGVVIVDSLSHFWEGEGGTLDIVDAAAERSHGNKFAGWKVGTPALRHCVDTLLGLDAHLIVTMRSKMAHILVENERGQQVPKKVGMAPVMRDGVEYEFTLVGDMDLEHRIVITKSRCKVLADQVIQPNRAGDMASTFRKWLESGEPIAGREDVDKVLGILNGIDDRQARTQAKHLFSDAYGKPEHLLASQVEEALTFAENLASGPPETKPSEPEVSRFCGECAAILEDHDPDGHDFVETTETITELQARLVAERSKKGLVTLLQFLWLLVLGAATLGAVCWWKDVYVPHREEKK